MQKITPFLWFDKNAEEAINFYVDIFKNAPYAKGESAIKTIKRYPDAPAGEKLGDPWKGMDGKILTGVFTLAGQQFMAIDGGPHFKPSGAISMLVECADQVEIDYYWDELTAGGDPAAQQCGWLADKFGFTWQICPDMARWLNEKDKAASDRAMAAMMEMKKIDIAKMEEAYKG